MTDELAPDVHEAVMRHCAVGDEFAGDRKFRDAIEEYNKAWTLLPDPKDQWDAATWILAAIGDAAFLDGYTELA